MARHRNVRSMNYEDEFYDDDDEEYYSRSAEDKYCISPSTAAQFTYRHDRNLSSFIDNKIDEGEEGDEEEAMHVEHRDEGDDHIQFNDINQAQLNSCLDTIRDILGNTVPEAVMTDAIMRSNYDVEVALNSLLTLQGAPKPQRTPRQSRNRSASGSGGGVLLKTPPTASEYRESRGPVGVTDSLSNLSLESDSYQPAMVVTNTCAESSSASSKNTSAKSSKANSKNTCTESSSASSKNTIAESLTTSSKNSSAESSSVSSRASSPPQETLTVNGQLPGDGESSRADNLMSPFPSSQSSQTPKKDHLDHPVGIPKSGSKTKEKINYKEEFRKRLGDKEQINLVVIGHVDAGKSTLMGHLLYQLGSVTKKTMHKYEQESRKIGKSSFAFAWVLDETDEERERGVTMDVGETRFETSKRIVTLLDAPGHKDFIPNMITGAAQADVAILVINATNGEFETGFDAGGQTREHTLLARSLGVSQVIVAVNKMDTVGWSKERYDMIVQKIGQFMKQAGFKDRDVSFVPLSGLCGENLIKPSTEPLLTAWYCGPSLVDLIDQFQSVDRPIDKPFRLSVSDIFKGQGSGMSVAGRMRAGHVQTSDKVLVMPAGQMATVKGVFINEASMGLAFAGDSVILSLTGIDANSLNVGCVICDPLSPPKCATRIRAKIVLFNLERPLTKGRVVFHYLSINEQAMICKLVAQLNKSTGEVVKSRPKCLLKNTSAIVEIEFERPICVELFKEFKELGRFMLRRDGSTIAAGLVEEVLQECPR